MSTKTTKKKPAEKIDFAAKKEEAALVVSKMHENLAGDILSEADWKARVSFMSRMHAYSPRNLLLMWSQWEERKHIRMVCRALEAGIFGAPISPTLPEFTHPAAASTWKKMGGHVTKDEKGLGVLAPYTVPDWKKDPDPITGKQPTKVIGFILKFRTFDIAQITGVEAPPEIVKLLKGDGPAEVWDSLVALAASLGYPVKVESVPGKANGFVLYGDYIAVEQANDPAQRIKTLAHEIGHVLLHAPEVVPAGLPDRVREIEAESVAYTVLNLIGYDTSDYSLGYVHGWAKGNGALIASTLERVAETATRIIGYLETGELPDGRKVSVFDFTEAGTPAEDGVLVA